jgi:hypothetical protein
MSARGFVAVLALMLLAAGVNAGEEDRGVYPIVVGTRVRLSAPTTVQGALRGTVIAIDDESLLLDTDDHRPLKVPRQGITQLELSTGRKGHARTGLIVGAVIGGALGATVPLDAMCTQTQIAAGESSCASRGALIATFAVADGAAGALIGHLIKGDRWSAVPQNAFRVALGPTRGKGAQLTLSGAW